MEGKERGEGKEEEEEGEGKGRGGVVNWKVTRSRKNGEVVKSSRCFVHPWCSVWDGAQC